MVDEVVDDLLGKDVVGFLLGEKVEVKVGVSDGRGVGDAEGPGVGIIVGLGVGQVPL